jgi:hypothetical protein
MLRSAEGRAGKHRPCKFLIKLELELIACSAVFIRVDSCDIFKASFFVLLITGSFLYIFPVYDHYLLTWQHTVHSVYLRLILFVF